MSKFFHKDNNGDDAKSKASENSQADKTKQNTYLEHISKSSLTQWLYNIKLTGQSGLTTGLPGSYKWK